MKLFWKIFFSTMFISAICVVVSGYAIIHTNFRAGLEREVKTSQEYGDVVYYALASEFTNLQAFSPSERTDTEIVDTISQIAYSVSVDMMNQKVLFAIHNEDGKPIFTSLPAALDKDMIGTLSSEKAGWTIKETGGAYYIQTIRPAIYGDSIFFVETLRDVSQIYQNQKSQYETLIVMMACMIAAVGILTFLITRWLLRQVTELTKITKTVADGNLSERAVPRGQDEIALLADNFNRMTDRLEVKMNELRNEAVKKERFVGAFSHELKTPLTSIIGYADLLRRKEMVPEQRHICAEYIFTEGKRLENLSMRLLDLIVLQNHTLYETPADIKAVLDDVISIVNPRLSAENIRLSYMIEPALISMEAELMKTVFLNLIDNARKAITGGGEIEIIGKVTSYGYTVRIRDTGRGMDEQELGRITEAFYMIDKSRSRKQGGAGLGLSICEEILKLHGFVISFESQVNVGTTVTVTLGENKS